MSNENSRETFDKNETGIAQTKQAIAEAAAAGDYDKVATLAQEAKGMEATKGEMVGEAQSEALEDNKAFDEAKAAEEKAKRDAELAEQAKLQAEKDSQEAAALLAKLQGNPAEAPSTETAGAATIENPGPTNAEAGQEGGEDIYGMSLPELQALIQSKGYGEEINAKDPNFKQKYAEFTDNRKKFAQAEVKLFDRVLSGEASEEEMEIAVEHARSQANDFGLDGFHSAVPKAWYTNDRLSNAMAETSPENKKWIEYVKQNYPNEQLKKQYRKIEENGDVSTYERK